MREENGKSGNDPLVDSPEGPNTPQWVGAINRLIEWEKAGKISEEECIEMTGMIRNVQLAEYIRATNNMTTLPCS
ncbi:MAG: hypothetical protein WCW56_00080 [Candidatus Paceibacterota bacterium]